MILLMFFLCAKPDARPWSDLYSRYIWGLLLHWHLANDLSPLMGHNLGSPINLPWAKACWVNPFTQELGTPKIKELCLSCSKWYDMISASFAYEVVNDLLYDFRDLCLSSSSAHPVVISGSFAYQVVNDLFYDFKELSLSSCK